MFSLQGESSMYLCCLCDRSRANVARDDACARDRCDDADCNATNSNARLCRACLIRARGESNDTHTFGEQVRKGDIKMLCLS